MEHTADCGYNQGFIQWCGGAIIGVVALAGEAIAFGVSPHPSLILIWVAPHQIIAIKTGLNPVRLRQKVEVCSEISPAPIIKAAAQTAVLDGDKVHQ